MPAALGHRELERPAAVTATDVCAHSPSSQAPAVTVGEHALNAGATKGTPLFVVHQRSARLEHGLHRGVLAAP
jgi:hypothetical protein